MSNKITVSRYLNWRGTMPSNGWFRLRCRERGRRRRGREHGRRIGSNVKGMVKDSNKWLMTERFEPDPPRETEENEGTNCSLHRK